MEENRLLRAIVYNDKMKISWPVNQAPLSRIIKNIINSKYGKKGLSRMIISPWEQK